MALNNVLRWGALALAVGMSGCGSSTLQAPTVNPYTYDVPNSTLHAKQFLALPHASNHSWAAPDTAKSALMYVSSLKTSSVNFYSYPQGKLKGKIMGLSPPYGLCSDAKGDVFVPQELLFDVVEYAHGSEIPIKTLNSAGEPIACAVDPMTGILAVVDVTGASTLNGNIALYANGSGAPEVLSVGDIELPIACGFDDKGNLFVDGWNGIPSQGAVFKFAELQNGKTSFTDIAINKKINIPGMVQWDGKFMAVGDAKNGRIYRIDGASGKIESTVTVAAHNDYSPWIQGTTVLVPSFYSIYTDFAHYPGGGKAYKEIKIGSSYGVTVSVAPK